MHVLEAGDGRPVDAQRASLVVPRAEAVLRTQRLVAGKKKNSEKKIFQFILPNRNT